MTIFIVAITAIVSFAAFNNNSLMQRLLLSPYLVFKNKQWYRLVSHVFVHVDFMHLLVNMIVFLSFGLAAENILGQLKGAGIISSTTLHFLILYFGGAVISTLTTLRKHKDDYYYQSVGASGAVSGVIMFCIFFNPLDKLYFMAFLPIPGIVFAIAYLIYSQYMRKKGTDNINHDAHFAGAVFGFVYPILIDPKLFLFFLKQIGLM